MFITPELALFSHVTNRADEEIDLGQAAILLGLVENPDLDISYYLRRLELLSEDAKYRVDAAIPRVVGLSRFLFEERRFRGNAEEYQDPRNSFLGSVLDRRIGIPISLSVLMMEVGQRIGITVEGVNFPGNFLVRSPVGQGYLFFDPFQRGQIVNRQGLRALYKKTTGIDRDPEVDVLQKAPKRQILIRMLQNLRKIYSDRNNKKALHFILERAALLNPEDESLAKELAEIPKTSLNRSLLN